LSGIVSTGPECGLGGVNTIPTTGYQSSLSLQQGYGYVGQLGDGTYIRLYVSSVAGSVYNIQYEYPATVCPSGAVSKYTGDSSAGHAVFTFNNSTVQNTGYSGPRRFPFYGCSGAAKVQVWGGGGAGGAGSDGGGGGGGGGGYVSQTLTLVPGQWYLLTIGAGGQTIGTDSGTSGTDSSFAIEAGSAILTATGGKGGTWDGYNSYNYGIGGQPGAGSSSDSSSVSTKIAGTAGGNGGAVNTCGGFGTTGPAGAGGAGGNGGDGGKGGCNPGSAGAPGGGGSGGSQGSLGGASSGAYGQVTITWQ
ncbi:MAG TPA: hypothetical protein VMH83_08445, partial [Candidatus Acidoferrum sp.]|nr:hypothetical protein [Candidatus Acidoferrum sp.]